MRNQLYSENNLFITDIINNHNSLDEYIEELISVPKIATEILDTRTKQKIPNEFKLRVKSKTGHLKNLKVLAIKAGGQHFISLVTEQGDILRQYHYQYNGHKNPDKSKTGKSHKHFPTRIYPLRKSHKRMDTWAYDPTDIFPADFVEAVKHFCKECNIEVNALQERLEWFR